MADWSISAECVGYDPDMFFPERGGATAAAKELCRVCIVRQDCLDYALDNGIHHGIWGGTSERQRRVIRRQRAGLSIVASEVTSDSDNVIAITFEQEV